MKHVALVLASLYTSYASPLSESRAAPGSIGTECTNVRVDSYQWLIGDCLTGSGTERITSGTSLRNKIVNDDGVLKWAPAEGDGLYSNSCRDCKLLNGGSDLNCSCNPNFGSNKNTTIKLDEHIGVYSGHLLSNLRGAPVVPSAPSKYEWPSTPIFGIGGNATCPESAEYDWCQSVQNKCSNTTPDSFSEVSIQHWTPLPACYIPRVYMPNKFNYNKLKLAGVGAWELTGYADEECKEKVVTVSPEQRGECLGLSKTVRGFTARPLFNGDPK